MDEKLKNENMQKELFSEWGGEWGEVIRVIIFMLYFESNQGRQV